MVTTKTTLVLGAGVSEEFGFPSGLRLARDLAAPDLNGGLTGPLATLISAGFPAEEVQAFARALRLSGKLSVDAFLEHRPDLMAVGKAAIAAALIPHENTLALTARPDGPSLYDHIWASLNSEPDKFLKNQLQVVTFNYDRPLEEYLAQALAHSYSLNADQVAHLAAAVPIVHMHGSLGHHPSRSESPARRYDTELSADTIKVAANGIRILHEDAASAGHLAEAHALLHDSRRIVFLGFGYDPINVRRLGLDQLGRATAVLGSVYGLTDHEVGAVRQRLGGSPRLGNTDWKSLRFVRETLTL